MPTDSSCRCLSALILVFCSFAFSAHASTDYSHPFSDSTVTHKIDSAAIAKLDWLKPDLRVDMVTYAQEFLGIHYRYAGRAPQTGFDCSGFTHFVMRNFDVDISTSSRAQIADGKKIDLKLVKPGDLIFFRRSSRSRISHVAMVFSNDENGLRVIHSTSRGVVIDDLMKSKYWRPKIYAARDVLHQFTDDYAHRQIELFLEQSKKLQEMNVDLALLAKGIHF
ncbi:MAG: C40 family peptidase [Saprospiraceae bacterium]|nr:C40 family peptidase [Saprospiraceae bacterium]